MAWNRQVRLPSPWSSLPSTRPLPQTSQATGARTATVKGPLRSGWSKQAKTLWASKGSKCVYR